MYHAERATIDRRLETLDQKRGFLMRERENVGTDRNDRRAFNDLARRFNKTVIEARRADLVVPLFR